MKPIECNSKRLDTSSTSQQKSDKRSFPNERLLASKFQLHTTIKPFGDDYDIDNEKIASYVRSYYEDDTFRESTHTHLTQKDIKPFRHILKMKNMTSCIGGASRQFLSHDVIGRTIVHSTLTKKAFLQTLNQLASNGKDLFILDFHSDEQFMLSGCEEELFLYFNKLGASIYKEKLISGSFCDYKLSVRILNLDGNYLVNMLLQ